MDLSVIKAVVFLIHNPASLRGFVKILHKLLWFRTRKYRARITVRRNVNLYGIHRLRSGI